MSDGMDIEAALAALDHIKETLSSYRGLEPRQEETGEESAPTETPEEEAAEPEMEVEAEVPVELAEVKEEKEPMRIAGHLLSSKPSAPPMPSEPPRRGPGRPKKVR